MQYLINHSGLKGDYSAFIISVNLKIPLSKILIIKIQGRSESATCKGYRIETLVFNEKLGFCHE